MSRSVWLLLLSGCAPGPLATIPEGSRVDIPVAFSRDGRRCVYVERAADGAVRGSWTGTAFDSL